MRFCNRSVLYTSDSRRFFQIVLSISESLPENSSLNYELDGFCPVQIGCVEAEIRNLKEDLHTKIFLILYNRKVVHYSSPFMVCSRGLTVDAVSQERLDGFECNLHRIDRR